MVVLVFYLYIQTSTREKAGDRESSEYRVTGHGQAAPRRLAN
jgi:hypothetical protein